MVLESLRALRKEYGEKLEYQNQVLKDLRKKWSMSGKEDRVLIEQKIKTSEEVIRNIWLELNPINQNFEKELKKDNTYQSWRRFVDFSKGKNGSEILLDLCLMK